MSAGDYGIFFQRPIAIVMFGFCALLLVISLKPLFFRSSKDWRSEVGLENSDS
jgi:hypothetical protein